LLQNINPQVKTVPSKEKLIQTIENIKILVPGSAVEVERFAQPESLPEEGGIPLVVEQLATKGALLRPQRPVLQDEFNDIEHPVVAKDVRGLGLIGGCLGNVVLQQRVGYHVVYFSEQGNNRHRVQVKFTVFVQNRLVEAFYNDSIDVEVPQDDVRHKNPAHRNFQDPVVSPNVQLLHHVTDHLLLTQYVLYHVGYVGFRSFWVAHALVLENFHGGQGLSLVRDLQFV